jgi:hypothetical protein
LSVSDDDEIRARALFYLEQAIGDRARDRVKARADRLRDAWKADLPFVPLTQSLVLGPRTAPQHCAGLGHQTASCATTWRTWRERTEAEQPPD